MNVTGIDRTNIDAMLAQLHAVAGRMQVGAEAPDATQSASGAGFGAALKASLDQVNNTQQASERMAHSFAIGDDSVNLSDVMISTQKANIAFQAAVQVRNKLVSAYHDVMAMSI